MRLLCIAIFAVELVHSRALTTDDWSEGDLLAYHQELPNANDANNANAAIKEGSSCQVQSATMTWAGIQLRRDQCFTSLSVLGSTFTADFAAQALPGYMNQIQCCLDVPCVSKDRGLPGFCANYDKECYKAQGLEGDCPALNSKCCVENKLLGDSSLDGTEDAFPISDLDNPGWGQPTAASIFSPDGSDENQATLNTLSGYEGLDSKAGPVADLVDEGDQNLFVNVRS